VVAATSAVSAASVAALVAVIGLRPAPEPREVPLSLAAGDAGDAGDASFDPAEIVVTVRGGAVLVDGIEVERTDGIEPSGQVQKVDGLFRVMVRRRQEARLNTANAPYVPNTPSVLLDVAADTPGRSGAVK
jgi:hypothetical protein